MKSQTQSKNRKHRVRISHKHVNDLQLAKAIVQLIRETRVPAKIVLEVR